MKGEMEGWSVGVLDGRMDDWKVETEGQRDRGTEGQRDKGTKGQRDRGTRWGSCEVGKLRGGEMLIYLKFLAGF